MGEPKDSTESISFSGRLSLTDIGFGSWLLPAATVVCFVAAIGGFRFQQPASDNIREFNWLSRCWLEPCSIVGPPTLPWERFALGPSLQAQAIRVGAVGPEKTFVVGGKNGRVHRWTPESQWEELPGLSISSSVSPVAVGLGPDGTIVVGDKKNKVHRWTPENQWKKLPELPIPPSVRITAIGSGLDGIIVVGDEYGKVYRSTPEDQWEELPGLSISSSAIAIAIGSGPYGTIVVGDKDGRIRQSTPQSQWEELPKINDFSRTRTVAVSPDGTIIVGDENSRVFQSTPPYGQWEFLDLGLPSSSRLDHFAIGPTGIILMTTVGDGTQTPVLTWIPITPALWAWILLVIGFVDLFYFVRLLPSGRQESRELDVPNIESDKPIDHPDQATKTMREVATRISLFVRNPDASAPLTFALTGKWGSGKSSLMKLVERDLNNDGCPCVWFNAWHHQSETHLFAALMESIRRNAVPRSLLGCFKFHINLARLRIQEFQTPAILLVLLVVGSLPLSGWLKSVLGADQPWLIPPAIATLFMVMSRRNPLKAFRVTPASLVRASSALIQFPRFQDRLSFRHQFGRAFGEVCEAFDDRRLVIIIDDLDRCQSEQVVELLEAVNFLTSSGDCFILLGIDEDQVKRAVGLYYKDIAEETAREKQQAADSVNKIGNYQARQSYAEHYLKKLINMNVKVPVFDNQALSEIREPDSS